MRNFYNYMSAVGHELCQSSWPWGQSQMVGAAIALVLSIATLWLQIKSGLMAKANASASWLPIFGPYIILFALLLVVKLLRSLSALHNRQVSDIVSCRAQASDLRTALRSSITEMQEAGTLSLLAEEADYLLCQFDEILSQNATDQHSIDMSHPFTSSILFTGDAPQGWQHRRLASFRDRYTYHRTRVLALPDNFRSPIRDCALPNEGVTEPDVRLMLNEHQKALVERRIALQQRYSAMAMPQEEAANATNTASSG